MKYNTSVQYRPVNSADLEDIALVIERANAKRDNQPIPTASPNSKTITDIKEKMATLNSWTYVASIGGKIVGIVLSHPSSEARYIPTDLEIEYLSRLMVDPDYWRQKIASRLVDLTTKHAQDDGNRQLILWTSKDKNGHARGFYEHKGFRLTDQAKVSEKYGTQVQYILDL